MAKRFQTISSGLSVENFDAVMAAARARGLSPSELIREGMRALGIPVPQTPQEWARLATKPTKPTQPTAPSQSLEFTGLTPRPRWPRPR